jgi:hypothetical protein
MPGVCRCDVLPIFGLLKTLQLELGLTEEIVQNRGVWKKLKLKFFWWGEARCLHGGGLPLFLERRLLGREAAPTTSRDRSAVPGIRLTLQACLRRNACLLDGRLPPSPLSLEVVAQSIAEHYYLLYILFCRFHANFFGT